MIINERASSRAQALDIAGKMMVSARTAPKGKGVDIIECITVDGEHKHSLAEEMRTMYQELGYKLYIRDANNVDEADCVVLLGTKSKLMTVNCGYCGYPTCGDKPEGEPCAINSVDLGIAIGSACSKAMDYRVDTRVMVTAGLAAKRIGLFGEEMDQVYAILVSIGSKNPFFDRKRPQLPDNQSEQAVSK